MLFPEYQARSSWFYQYLFTAVPWMIGWMDCWMVGRTIIKTRSSKVNCFQTCLLQATLQSMKKINIGKIGFWTAISPWIAYPIVILCSIIKTPGFGWGSIYGFLAGIIVTVVPALSLIICTVGLLKDESKRYAWIGLVIGLVTSCMVYGFMLYALLKR